MKSFISILMLVAVAWPLVGCGKDKGGNNNNDPYGNGYYDNAYNNNCYGNGNGYGPGGAGAGFYQWQGNRCVDTRRPGVSVDARYCNNNGGSNNFNGGWGGGCNNTGWNNNWNNNWSNGYSYSNSGSWNYNVVNGFSGSICAPGFTPVPMYGFYNQIMCVESGFIPFVTNNYGTPYMPSMYSGYGFGAVGCIPGSSPCSCRPVGAGITLGAQFGSAYAGISAGICF